jgi:chemotaxis response regulator CheB
MNSIPPKSLINKTTFKVMIVNDSPMLTAVLNAILKTTAEYQVIGQAADGAQAIKMFTNQRADIVLMDIHMPNMDGVKATREICRLWPKTRVLIVTATVTMNMAHIFSALNAGAMDYVQTPTLPFKPGMSVSNQQLINSGERLLHKLKSLRNIQIPSKISTSTQPVVKTAFSRDSTKNADKRSSQPTATGSRPQVIAIGCSTGGPTTLSMLLKKFTAPPTCPVIICQHIEPGFVGDFAAWIETECGLPTFAAQKGQKMQNGCLYVAPAAFNLSIEGGRFVISHPTQEQYFTPNIDFLFTNLANQYGQRALGVVLTGMGADGAVGAKHLVDKGGKILTQDKQSALIDSMPESTRKAVNNSQGYQLNQIAVTMERWMKSIDSVGHF